MNVGVVGLGYWGPNIVRNLLSLEQRVHVFDRDEQRMAEVLGRFPACTPGDAGIFESREIDAIAIAVPLPDHARLVKRALDAARPVFVEKPLCATLDEANDIAARAGEHVVMVGHITAFSPGLRALRSAVTRGDIGEPRGLHFTRTHFGPTYSSTDVLTEVAAHDVAIVLSLVEDPPKRVNAWGVSRTGGPAADSACLVLSWNDGRFARIEAGWTSAHRVRRAVVEGVQGTLTFETDADGERLTRHDQAEGLAALARGESPRDAARLARRIQIPLETSEPLRDELETFLHCAANGRRPETDLAFGRRVVAVLEAARHAMQSGERITISW